MFKTENNDETYKCMKTEESTDRADTERCGQEKRTLASRSENFESEEAYKFDHSKHDEVSASSSSGKEYTDDPTVRPHECNICGETCKTKETLVHHRDLNHKHVLYNCDVCGNYYRRKENLELHLMLNKNVFRCDGCHKATHDRAYLLKHTCKGILPTHYCEVCGKGFTKKNYLTKHMRMHKFLRCKICYKTFALVRHLNHHMKLHTGGPHTCGVCNKSFVFKSRLKKHMTTHERRQQCRICGKSFFTKSSLKKHTRLEHGVEYQCDYCKKIYKNRQGLVRHISFHIGYKLPCTVCDKSFPFQSALNAHMVGAHSDERPYSCSICHKTFGYIPSLRHHMRGHSAERRFACDLCGASFHWKNTIQLHMQRHMGERPYKCNVCDKTFFLKGSLAKHIATHTAIYYCAHCGQHSNGIEAYRAHSLTHRVIRPYKCRWCREKFATSKELWSHKVVHKNPLPVRCKKCGQRFKTKDHLRVHLWACSTEQTLSCEFCGLVCHTTNDMNMHYVMCARPTAANDRHLYTSRVGDKNVERAAYGIKIETVKNEPDGRSKMPVLRAPVPGKPMQEIASIVPKLEPTTAVSSLPDLDTGEPVNCSKMATIHADVPVNCFKMSTIHADEPVNCSKMPALRMDEPVKSSKIPILSSNDAVKSSKMPFLPKNEPVIYYKMPFICATAANKSLRGDASTLPNLEPTTTGVGVPSIKEQERSHECNKRCESFATAASSSLRRRPAESTEEAPSSLSEELDIVKHELEDSLPQVPDVHSADRLAGAPLSVQVVPVEVLQRFLALYQQQQAREADGAGE